MPDDCVKWSMIALQIAKPETLSLSVDHVKSKKLYSVINLKVHWSKLSGDAKVSMCVYD